MEVIKRCFRKWAVVAIVGVIMPLLSSENRENIEVPPIVEFIHNADNELSNQLHIISPFERYYHGVISYKFSPSKQYILINIKSNASGVTRMLGKLPGEVLSPVYTTKLINMRSGKEIKTFEFIEPAIMYEFSPNEKLLLIAGLKKSLGAMIGWTKPSTLHAYQSGKRAPSDTGEILHYDLFDMDSQSMLKTLENIQIINFNENNELIVKYDDGFKEKMTFPNKQSLVSNVLSNVFAGSVKEKEIKDEDFPIIQTMYDVQKNKTFYLTLPNEKLNSKEEVILCPNTISYDFSPQKQYLFIKQLPSRSIPAQSLESIARNIGSGTAGYLAGTSIRGLLGGLPGIITGGAFAPVVGYMVGNIVSDVRSISSFLTIKNGKIIAVFKNVVTYEFNPDETRLLILCPEEGWIKLGDIPVYQLFDTKNGTKIKTFADVQSAYFKENELIIRKNGEKISYAPETGDFVEKEEKEEQEKREKEEYERTVLGRLSYAIRAVKERGLETVMSAAKEFLGKNKPQEELLPTTMKYEYPAVNLTEVVVVEEPKVVVVEEQEVVLGEEPKERTKLYDSSWEQVLDDLSDKETLGNNGVLAEAWMQESIEFAMEAIEEDEKTVEQLADELYSAYLKELVSRQSLKRGYSIKDPIEKARKIKNDFIQGLNQQLKEEQVREEIQKQKEPIEEQEGEQIQRQRIEEEKVAEEEKKRELVEQAGTPELKASLDKAMQPVREREQQKEREQKEREQKSQLATILNDLSRQGPSQDWQNSIITNSNALIVLARDKNKTRTEIINSINTAIDNYMKTLWFPNTLWFPSTKAILAARNNILKAIYSEELRMQSIKGKISINRE